MYEKVCAYGTSPMGYLWVYINFTANRKGTEYSRRGKKKVKCWTKFELCLLAE